MAWRAFVALLVSLGAVLGAGAGEVTAQGYPNKPIRFIAPFPPGSAAEILGRVIGLRLSDRLGQPVIVETKPGAGGTIGADLVAKSAPDGYTVLVGSSAEVAVGVSLYSKIPYNTLRDFAPVIMIGPMPNILVANPNVPVKSVQELVALAKSKPGQLNFASSGNGTSSHLASEMLKQMAGIDMVHIPYRGSPPAITDTLGGRTAVMFGPMATVLPHVQGGKLRALAVSTTKRSAAAPEVPTMMESGFPEFEASLWWGFLVPAATPKDIVGKLNEEIGKILQLPDVRETLAKSGVEPAGGTPDHYAAHIKAEIAKWAKVIKESGARID